MTDQIRADLTFSIVPDWLLDSDLSDRAVRLYAVLASYADNRTGRAFPSRATLAKRLRCSVGTVDRALAELVASEAVTKQARTSDGGSQTSNLYVVRRGAPPVTRGGPTGDEGGASPVGPELEPQELDPKPLEKDARAATLFGTPEPPPSKPARRKPERSLPSGWEPPGRVREWATAKAPSVDLDLEAEKFANHAASVDRRARDWTAAFRNWLLKAEEYASRNGQARGGGSGAGRAFEGAASDDPGYWTPKAGVELLTDDED